jgi:hypothetical protein
MGVSALRVFPWLEQLAMPLGLHRVLGPYTQMLTQTCSMEVRLKTLRAPSRRRRLLRLCTLSAFRV